jgi:DNA adenine methylase
MKKQRAFLKWAGGKYSLIESITEFLPTGNVLVEPFVGAGSVFSRLYSAIKSGLISANR